MIKNIFLKRWEVYDCLLEDTYTSRYYTLRNAMAEAEALNHYRYENLLPEERISTLYDAFMIRRLKY